MNAQSSDHASPPVSRREFLIMSAGATAGVIFAGASTASAASGDNYLTPGQQLTSGQSLISSNGQSRLVMQDDGNLVIYALGRALWNSETRGSGATRAVLQGDGNFVLYAPGGKAVWHTKTNGQTVDRLKLEDYGLAKLVNGSTVRWHTGRRTTTLYRGKKLTTGQILVSDDLKYKLILQSDGNLVLYQSGTALWNTKTNTSDTSKRPVQLNHQTDGNLVLYDAAGTPRWNTRTDGQTTHRLALQTDGNLVLYDPDNKPVWHRFDDTSTSRELTAEFNAYPEKDAPKQAGEAEWGDPPISSRGYYKRNCTDYTAWWLQRHGVSDSLTRGHGNGGSWGSDGRSGVAIVSAAKPGDAYVTGPTAKNEFGHVGIILKVSGTTLKTANYNGFDGQPYLKDVSTSSTLRILRFSGFKP